MAQLSLHQPMEPVLPKDVRSMTVPRWIKVTESKTRVGVEIFSARVATIDRAS
jgi:hypothetical protein